MDWLSPINDTIKDINDTIKDINDTIKDIVWRLKWSINWAYLPCISLPY